MNEGRSGSVRVWLLGLLAVALVEPRVVVGAGPSQVTQTYDVSALVWEPGSAGPVPKPGTAIEPEPELSPRVVFEAEAGKSKPGGAPAVPAGNPAVPNAVPVEDQPRAQHLMASIHGLLASSDGASVQWSGSKLTLTASPETHEAVSRLLSAAHRALRSVSVEVTVATVDPATLAGLPMPIREAIVHAGSRRDFPVTLPTADADALLSAVRSAGGSRIEALPTLKLISGQSGRMSVGSYEMFTTDYDADGKPVVAPVYSGIGVHVLASSADRGSPQLAEPPKADLPVALHVSVSRSKVGSVKEAEVRPSPQGSPLTTRTPERVLHTAQGLVCLEQGQTGLFVLSTSLEATTIVLTRATPGLVESLTR